MYRCENCKKVVPKGTPCSKVVTRTKTFRHPFRPKVQKRWVLDKTGKMKQESADDPGGIGPQIEHEAQFCSACAAKFEKSE